MFIQLFKMKTNNILVWLYFLCDIFVINCRKRNSIFNHVSTYDSMKCTNALFEHNVTVEMSCTSICLGRTDCLGVFYSRSTTLCTGCGHLSRDNLEGSTADTKYLCNFAIAAPWTNFDGSYYKVFTDDKSFEEAKRYCSDNFCSYLVHFDSSEEVEFVNDLAIRTGVSDYWLGLEYDTTDSKWKWVDDNTEATFTDWHPDEPNSLPDQDCTRWGKNFNEKWDNMECYILIPFVCEKRNSFA